MNANEIKAREIESQKAHIMNLVENPSKNGSASWLFFGTLYRETVSFLKKEGFRIKKVSDGDTNSNYLPVYRIICVGVKPEGTFKSIEEEIAEDETGWLGILYENAHLP